MFGKLDNLSKQASKTPLAIPKRKREDDPANHSTERKYGNKPMEAHTKKKSSKNSEVRSRIDQDLIGSKFRLMNEFLYTTTSEKAFDHFSNNTKDFEIYHKGFQMQTQKWPAKPVELIIKDLATLPQYKNAIVCDLGCGEGFIYEHFEKTKRVIFAHNENITEEEASHRIKLVSSEKNKNHLKKIYSFDIVSNKPFIQACDIACLPLAKKSIDVAVFCLALMGTNYLDFLWEATRCLKKGGFLIVAEVLSRIPELEAFIEMVCVLGYELVTEGKSSTYFVILTFKKVKNKKKKKIPLEKSQALLEKLQKLTLDPFPKNLRQASKVLLNACLYKRR